MIRNQWYAVLEGCEVRAGRPVGVTRMGEKLVFFRTSGGEVACLPDRCAHRGAMLSAGKMCGDRMQCPFHGFEYDTTGRVKLIPSNGRNAPVPENFRVNTYPAREAHGYIWIYWGDVEAGRELPEIGWFDDLDGSFSRQTFQDHWATHYSRCIENQLDPMHLPFVHHNTIGRGNKTVVNGPRVEENGDVLKFWVKNEVDDGRSPKKPVELSREESFGPLTFIFPNIWQNRIGDRFRATALFVPVDEENTIVYITIWQKVIKVPVLSWIFNNIANRFNRIVLHQDRRVVLTQQPKRTELKMGENLAQGDLPILAYRRRRQALLDGSLK